MSPKQSVTKTPNINTVYELHLILGLYDDPLAIACDLRVVLHRSFSITTISRFDLKSELMISVLYKLQVSESSCFFNEYRKFAG